jgi:hypothetical protein
MTHTLKFEKKPIDPFARRDNIDDYVVIDPRVNFPSVLSTSKKKKKECANFSSLFSPRFRAYYQLERKKEKGKSEKRGQKKDDDF